MSEIISVQMTQYAERALYIDRESAEAGGPMMQWLLRSGRVASFTFQAFDLIQFNLVFRLNFSTPLVTETTTAPSPSAESKTFRSAALQVAFGIPVEQTLFARRTV